MLLLTLECPKSQESLVPNIQCLNSTHLMFQGEADSTKVCTRYDQTTLPPCGTPPPCSYLSLPYPNPAAIDRRCCCQAYRGGAAVYSAGTTTFHGKAYFLGNGQYEADASGYEPSNEDGGALSNSGTMTVGARVFRFFLGGGLLSSRPPRGALFSAHPAFGLLLVSSLLGCCERVLPPVFPRPFPLGTSLSFVAPLSRFFNKSCVTCGAGTAQAMTTQVVLLKFRNRRATFQRRCP